MTLFDSHAHLQEREFAGDIDAVIKRARDAGVRQIVVPAVDLATARASVDLAERYEGLYATAGYHPHEAGKLTDAALEAVEQLLAHPKVVAVGEIGLDYYRMHSTRDEQITALEKQLTLAEEHTMPVIVHCRDAWENTAAVLQSWAGRVAARFAGRPLGVLHYFSGSLAQAEAYGDLGFLISIHTSVTHPRAHQLREVAASLPLDRLVIETDSPYGAPQAYRGKRNEPAYVADACREIARLRGISETVVAEATTGSARRLFRIPAGASAVSHTGAAI